MNNKVEQPVKSYTEFEKLNWVTTKAIPQIGEEVCVKINSISWNMVSLDYLFNL